MLDTFTKLIADTLALPEAEMPYWFSSVIAEIYPENYILETTDYDFDLQDFARRGRCRLTLSSLAHAHLEAVDERPKWRPSCPPDGGVRRAVVRAQANCDTASGAV